MSLDITINYEIERLRRTMAMYGEVSGKTESEVVVKQAGKLGFNIRAGMSRIAPEKGAVRAERLMALRTGGGIKIRPGVVQATAEKYGLAFGVRGGRMVLGKRKVPVASVVHGGKRMNFWALAAQREINLRESGKGFMAFSTPRAYANEYARSDDVEFEKNLFSRYGYLLSQFGIKADPSATHKYAELKWVGGDRKNSSPVEGLQREKAMQVLVDAVRETNADIMVYLERKISEDINRFFQ